MNREEKIAALRRVLNGEPVEKAFPAVQVFIVDRITDTHSLIMIENSNRDTIGEIPNEQVEGYIKYTRKQNFCKRMEVTRIDRQEYEQLSEAFEKEF